MNVPPANSPAPAPKNNRLWIIILAICLAAAGGVIVYLVVAPPSAKQNATNLVTTATPMSTVTTTVITAPTPTATPQTTVTVTPTVTATPPSTGYDMTGRAMAPDGTFSVYVGPKMADKTFVDFVPVQGATNSYDYCYKLADPNYDGGMCGLGKVPLFTITTYTPSQLAVAQREPMFMGQVFKENAGLSYVFFQPNGEMPNEVLAVIPEPNMQEFYYTVMDSIVFY